MITSAYLEFPSSALIKIKTTLPSLLCINVSLRMARSKPTSSRTAPPRPFAPLRPYVRPTAPLPQSNRLSPATTTAQDVSDTVRQPDNPGYHEHGRIQEHDQSTGSLATSKYTSSDSEVSANLARNRHLSTIMTPTDSEAAYSEGGTSVSHGSSNMVGYTPGIAHRSRRMVLGLSNVPEPV